MRRIAILGSTGSIGTQSLDVIRRHPESFRAVALAARSSAEALEGQVREFSPAAAALVCPPAGFCGTADCQWKFGEEALLDICAREDVDAVLVAIVGIAGLPAVLRAIECGKTVLLANKEALVTGGALVMEAARRKGVALLPVDSEHSAIFQCIQGRPNAHPCRIVLTASGGPFRTWSREQIEKATVAQALRHPNWSMGRKITIDSASMVNKALEVIEARWLFDMAPENIQVVIHSQSVVHSGVEFSDGALLCQLGLPDMRVPIAYAMSYPDRLGNVGERLDLTRAGALTFEAPDFARFPALALAWEVLRAGGTAPVTLNGANEVAVDLVLQEKLPFFRIADLLAETLSRESVRPVREVSDVLEADRRARETALAIAKRWTD
ncbi:MAG: 1-deoxy-D-xylulose-5-phosphate reductoisomerase [Candidatus Spyradocola sp.]|jgi:1-deoxy-D-xylulose-5-phosphate reductoisomerase